MRCMAKSRGVMLTVLPVQVSKSPTQLCTDGWAFPLLWDGGRRQISTRLPCGRSRHAHAPCTPRQAWVEFATRAGAVTNPAVSLLRVCCLRAYFSSQADLQTRSIRRYTHVVGHHHKFRFGKLVSQFDSSLPRPAKAGMPDATHNTYALKPAPVTSCMPMRRGQRAGLGFDSAPPPPPPPPPQVPLKRPGCSRPAPHERESPI